MVIFSKFSWQFLLFSKSAGKYKMRAKLCLPERKQCHLLFVKDSPRIGRKDAKMRAASLGGVLQPE
jgi:hypothetical protein